MLNKLSFNIFNELNESESKKYQIKKRVLIESNGVKIKNLNEDSNDFEFLYDIDYNSFDNASLVQGCTELYLGETAEEFGISEEEVLNKQAQEYNVKIISAKPGYNGATEIVAEGTPSNVLKFFSQGDCDNAKDFSDSYDLEVKILDVNESEESSLVETSYEYMSNKSGIPVEDLLKVVPKLMKKDKNFRNYETGYQISVIKKELEKLKEAVDPAKEERLASLKIQLEKDGDQLADDEKEAIEKEIEELEKEVINESSNPEADEKVGGDYNEFIEELQNFRQLMVDQVEEQSTKLASQIIMNTIEEYDGIIRNYEREKDIEIEGAMNESSLTEDYSEKLGGDPEDFISDLKDIRKAIVESIDYDGLSTKLAMQMVMSFIETIDNQMEMIASRYGLEDMTIEEGCSKQKIEKSEDLTEAEEMKVKNLQVIKEQGNIYMLEDESKKMIVGENYNADEGIIENAEIYENKDEADKDYLSRCDIIKECSKINENASDRYQVREFDGPGAKFGVYDTKSKRFVQKGSKKVMTAACNDLNKNQK